MTTFRQSPLTSLYLLFGLIVLVQSYGFRYRFNPVNHDTQLWTHLPGMESPQVYDNNHLVQSAVTAFENPGLYPFFAPDGRRKWKCKIDAYYSDFFQKCLWKPGHYFANNFSG